MKVSDIDKNFEVKTEEKTQDCDYYDAKQPPFNFSGGFYEEENKKFVRVPTALAAKISRGVSILGNITAGMRVRFSTDSDFIELKVTYEKYFRMNTAPLTASAGFSLMEDLPEGGQAFTQIFFPDEGDDKGFIQRKTEAEIIEEMREEKQKQFKETKSGFDSLTRAISLFEGHKEFVVIRLYYFGEDINGNPREGGTATWEEIAEELSDAGILKEIKTARRWRNKIVNDMAVCVFGIPAAVSAATYRKAVDK